MVQRFQFWIEYWLVVFSPPKYLYNNLETFHYDKNTQLPLKSQPLNDLIKEEIQVWHFYIITLGQLGPMSLCIYHILVRSLEAGNHWCRHCHSGALLLTEHFSKNAKPSLTGWVGECDVTAPLHLIQWENALYQIQSCMTTAERMLYKTWKVQPQISGWWIWAAILYNVIVKSRRIKNKKSNWWLQEYRQFILLLHDSQGQLVFGAVFTNKLSCIKLAEKKKKKNNYGKTAEKCLLMLHSNCRCIVGLRPARGPEPHLMPAGIIFSRDVR